MDTKKTTYTSRKEAKIEREKRRLLNARKQVRSVIRNGKKVLLKETDEMIYHVMCVPISNSKNTIEVTRKVKKGKTTKEQTVTLHGIQAAVHVCEENKFTILLSTGGYIYTRVNTKEEAEKVKAALSPYCRCSITCKKKEEVVKEVDEKKPSNNTTEAKIAARERRKKENKKRFANRLLRKKVRMEAGKYRSFKKRNHKRGTPGSTTNVEKKTALNAKKAVKYIDKKESARVTMQQHIKAKQIKFNAQPKQQELKFAA